MVNSKGVYRVRHLKGSCCPEKDCSYKGFPQAPECRSCGRRHRECEIYLHSVVFRKIYDELSNLDEISCIMWDKKLYKFSRWIKQSVMSIRDVLDEYEG